MSKGAQIGISVVFALPSTRLKISISSDEMVKCWIFPTAISLNCSPCLSALPGVMTLGNGEARSFGDEELEFGTVENFSFMREVDICFN